ncbi:thioesterase family protein [Rubrimonas cliftonensis]|uniref:Acyl-CoA thioester hydrolase n=1 Tax=Rubrimonas cliftonensis TaxID=89524 RepID=A0A1H3VNN0_9RHOB|nr:thioesterase family protein [Rubrimonas cliftonensis]SDZ76403.1 acyl-CoA thioester hydrolase [Rubrimonas cliftonensis]
MSNLGAKGPFGGYRRAVPDDWLDYNGHLNEGFYVVAFSHASDLWMDAIGLDDAGRMRWSRSMFTVEAHVRYLAEVPAAAEISVATWIIGADDKRALAFSALYAGGAAAPAATHEALYLCVNTVTRRAGVWPAPVRAALDAMIETHRATPMPEGAGAALGPHRLKPV